MKHSSRSTILSQRGTLVPPIAITIAVFLIYWISNPAPMEHFDYTYRIAEAFLQGRLGLTETPPSWLNEMVPFEDRYHSVFPLGSVLTMIPFALLKSAHVIDVFPARFIAALVAAISALFFFLLSGNQNISLARRVLLGLFPLLATWTWCNLAYAGAWQLALGFALMGEAGALYFTLVNRRPLLAGFFFALAFGNRTEVLLTAPIFIYLLCRNEQGSSKHEQAKPQSEPTIVASAYQKRIKRRAEIGKFIVFPIALGLATLGYNHARFGSMADFGYMRIPQVASEEYFKHGLFSPYAIPPNARAMLWGGWKIVEQKPYLIPHGFGGSIFISSPLLLLLFRFRRGVKDYSLLVVSWIAIAILTAVLWLHANPGGWQFSYRYGMILLPWMFLIILNNGKAKASKLEVILFGLSVAINAYATYLFLWTDYVKP